MRSEGTSTGGTRSVTESLRGRDEVASAGGTPYVLRKKHGGKIYFKGSRVGGPSDSVAPLNKAIARLRILNAGI